MTLRSGRARSAMIGSIGCAKFRNRNNAGSFRKESRWLTRKYGSLSFE